MDRNQIHDGQCCKFDTAYSEHDVYVLQTKRLHMHHDIGTRMKNAELLISKMSENFNDNGQWVPFKQIEVMFAQIILIFTFLRT